MAESFRAHPASPPQPAPGAAAAAWDEMTDPRGQVRPHWQSLYAKILRWSSVERQSMAAAAARMIAALGATFSV